METLNFSIEINADKQKVWNTMLNDETYRQWTKAFHEGSYYEGSWEKGSEIHFYGPTDDKGNKEGMYARIKENVPHEFISIEHLGMIKNGVVDTTSEEVKKWTPALENYTFVDKGDKTEVKIEMQTSEEYKKMMEEMWPKALNDLKDLCEG